MKYIYVLIVGRTYSNNYTSVNACIFKGINVRGLVTKHSFVGSYIVDLMFLLYNDVLYTYFNVFLFSWINQRTPRQLEHHEYKYDIELI
jgi:hypothetical protein